MALPQLTTGLATPTARTEAPSAGSEVAAEDVETREVPIPVPPDVPEEEVEEAAQAAEEALPEDAEAVVGEPTDAPAATAETPEDMERTIDQLRSTGDPNEVKRTPVLESGNIEVAPDEWQLGFPLQGIPRLAAVLNLNYIYNDSRERWERDTGNRTLEPPFRGAFVPLGNVTVSGGTSEVVPLTSPRFASDVTVDTSADTLTVDTAGTYRVAATVKLFGLSADSAIEVSVEVNGTPLLVANRNIVLGNTGSGDANADVDGLVQLDTTDSVQLVVSEGSGNNIDLGGFGDDYYLTIDLAGT